MITSTSAFGKASAAESQKLISRVCLKKERLYSTTRISSASKYNGNQNGNGRLSKADNHQTQRDLFVNILNANATKRDAKQFLARFKSPTGPLKPSISPITLPGQDTDPRKSLHGLERAGVNLGTLYGPGRAIAETPQFVRQETREQTLPRQVVSAALVCLRAGEQLDEATLDGLALTLSQLVKLDMHIILVLEDDRFSLNTSEALEAPKSGVSEAAERICMAIAQHNPAAARYVDGAFELRSEATDEISINTGKVHVTVPQLILGPLSQRTIPVIRNLAYTTTGQLVHIEPREIMSALSTSLSQQTSNVPLAADSQNEDSRISVDRIIVLDEAGGTPSKARGDGAHVFINLDQEFSSILDELSEYASNSANNQPNNDSDLSLYTRQQDNLRMVQMCLTQLPSASSALIISPQEAAASSESSRKPRGSETGIGTRRQKNTLIHNLLTNKSLISSSLPIARLPGTVTTGDDSTRSPIWQTSTLVKRGMPLVMIPSPHRGSRWDEIGWLAPINGHTDLELENDSRIDLPRLVYLIENSFRRKLDVKHYLERIKGKIAGIIVAGNYEGAAILTWEQPPGTSDPSHLVPYLDKFAVLQSSQGSSGVADILFQAMVRSCFPNGVCWRSRKDNPVNKWYFERASATWQIPESMWTMFWTGEGVVEDKVRFNDYVGVCKNVTPSFYGTSPV